MHHGQGVYELEARFGFMEEKMHIDEVLQEVVERNLVEVSPFFLFFSPFLFAFLFSLFTLLLPFFSSSFLFLFFSLSFLYLVSLTLL